MKCDTSGRESQMRMSPSKIKMRYILTACIYVPMKGVAENGSLTSLHPNNTCTWPLYLELRESRPEARLRILSPGGALSLLRVLQSPLHQDIMSILFRIGLNAPLWMSLLTCASHIPESLLLFGGRIASLHFSNHGSHGHLYTSNFAFSATLTPTLFSGGRASS
jgi:hypothetical protein